MLRALKFVQGAVAKKDLLPAMTHFIIKDGHVRAYNGVLALSSPIPFDIDCQPKAGTLVQAISKCEETVTLTMTDSNRLRIQSGAFRAFVECTDDEPMQAVPEGDLVQLDGELLLTSLKAIAPFVGNDASRPWSNGILIRGQSAFATNNVIVAEQWLGFEMPEMNIPDVAIKEILRVNEPPTHCQLSENSVAFHYEDERWIRCQLYSTGWPDMGPILNQECNPEPIDQRIFDGIEALKPFVDKVTGRIIFSDGIMRTHKDDALGAAYELEGFEYEGAYQIAMLSLLKGMLTIDFSTYPSPCLFFGERTRGAIIGMRY